MIVYKIIKSLTFTASQLTVKRQAEFNPLQGAHNLNLGLGARSDTAASAMPCAACRTRQH